MLISRTWAVRLFKPGVSQPSPAQPSSSLNSTPSKTPSPAETDTDTPLLVLGPPIVLITSVLFHSVLGSAVQFHTAIVLVAQCCTVFFHLLIILKYNSENV